MARETVNNGKVERLEAKKVSMKVEMNERAKEKAMVESKVESLRK